MRWGLRFDLYELNAAVAEFCRRQFASEKQVYRVQLVMEEMLMHVIRLFL